MSWVAARRFFARGGAGGHRTKGVFPRDRKVPGGLQRQKYHLACYILIAADGRDYFQVVDAPTD